MIRLVRTLVTSRPGHPTAGGSGTSEGFEHRPDQTADANTRPPCARVGHRRGRAGLVQGLNLQLKGVAPARVFREQDLATIGPAVIAARAFAADG